MLSDRQARVRQHLLNLIGGLDQPTGGEIIVAGHRLSELRPSELIDFRMEHVGFVFQSYNLIPVLTAAENVGFHHEPSEMAEGKAQGTHR